jgi:ribosomal protein S2
MKRIFASKLLRNSLLGKERNLTSLFQNSNCYNFSFKYQSSGFNICSNSSAFFSTERKSTATNEKLIRTYVFLNTQKVSSKHINKKVLNHFSKKIINNNQLIIDLEETTNNLFTFIKFFKSFINDGGRALFVCQNPRYNSILRLLINPKTKKPFRQLSYSRYWTPGLLSNRDELDKSLQRLLNKIQESSVRKINSSGKSDSKNTALRPVISGGKLDPAAVNEKLFLFREIYQGIDRDDPRMPDLVFFLPTEGNRIPLHESTITNRITAGVVPVYADPNVVHYPIIANHKSPHALTFILYTIISSVYGGKPKYKAKPRNWIGGSRNKRKRRVQIGSRAFSTSSTKETKEVNEKNSGNSGNATSSKTDEPTDRLHSTDIAFKPNKSGWGYTKQYSSNFDDIFKKKHNDQ